MVKVPSLRMITKEQKLKIFENPRDDRFWIRISNKEIHDKIETFCKLK